MAEMTQNVSPSPIPPAVGGSNGLDDILKTGMQESIAGAKELRGAGVKAAGDIETERKAISELESPKAPTMPKPPEPKQSSPMEAFGSPAMWLATFGSLMTRHSLTNSLNAASGVMNAKRSGDKAEFDRQMEVWKMNMDYLDKQFDFEKKAYDAALNKHKDNADLTKAEVTALAASFKDTNASMILATRGLDEFRKTTNDRFNQADKLRKGWADVLAQQTVEDRKQKFIDENGIEPSPEQMLAWTKEAQVAAKGKISPADIKQEQANKDLDDLIKNAEELKGMVDADPSLVGMRGAGKRIVQKIGGQIKDKDYYPEATNFESKIEDLKATLANPLLRTRYFSGPAAKKMDQLVKGLGRMDDPTTVKQSFDALIDILKEKRGASGSSKEIIEDGYRYLGGDKGSPDSWEKVE